MHRHRPAATVERPFTGPVAARENRAAHGAVCYVATCHCGAQRRTNVNGRAEERGPWIAPAPTRES